MARSHVVTGLEYRYARLLGLQATSQNGERAANLAHIRAVILLFEPHWDSDAVRPVAPRTPVRWRRKGDGFKFAVQALREAKRPLSATEIAIRALDLSGIDLPPASYHRIIGTDLSYGLRRLFGDALQIIEGRPRRYRLMPPTSNIPSTGATGERSSQRS